MLFNIIDRESVDKMVRSFYTAILEDDLVGPYFIKSLGDDFQSNKWYGHFKTLNDFWIMLMTAEEGYMGDPFVPHAFLGELYPEIFVRWLELFHTTLYQHFTPAIAQKFYKKGEILSAQFMERLEIVQK